jgi:hypothetical protein
MAGNLFSKIMGLMPALLSGFAKKSMAKCDNISRQAESSGRQAACPFVIFILNYVSLFPGVSGRLYRA